MSQAKLNKLLERYARANDGTNHGSDYVLNNLPKAGSLIDALGLYFAQSETVNGSKLTEAWDICTVAIDQPDDVLLEIAQYWFFGLDYSPKVLPSEATVGALDFVVGLRSVVGNAAVFEVRAIPPKSVWYECVWRDFAFDGQTQRWLLHFGFSD